MTSDEIIYKLSIIRDLILSNDDSIHIEVINEAIRYIKEN